MFLNLSLSFTRHNTKKVDLLKVFSVGDQWMEGCKCFLSQVVVDGNVFFTLSIKELEGVGEHVQVNDRLCSG